MDERFKKAAEDVVRPMMDYIQGMTNEELGLAREGFVLSDEQNCWFAVRALKYEMLGLLAMEAQRRDLKPEDWLVMPKEKADQ